MKGIFTIIIAVAFLITGCGKYNRRALQMSDKVISQQSGIVPQEVSKEVQQECKCENCKSAEPTAERYSGWQIFWICTGTAIATAAIVSVLWYNFYAGEVTLAKECMRRADSTARLVNEENMYLKETIAILNEKLNRALRWINWQISGNI
jgi:hypothetical protein